MDTRFSETLPPNKANYPIGYRTLNIDIEVHLGSTFSVLLIRKDENPRLAPLSARTGDVFAVLGVENIEYFHPTAKKDTRKAMDDVLESEDLKDLSEELQWLKRCINSEEPEEWLQQICEELKTTREKALKRKIAFKFVEGRYVNKYLHDLPPVIRFHEKRIRDSVINGGDGRVNAKLPKLPKINAPLFSMDKDIFASFGQEAKESLNMSTDEALKTTKTYTQLIEAEGHHIDLGHHEFCVWAFTKDCAQLSTVASRLLKNRKEAKDLKNIDVISTLQKAIASIQTGAKSISIPDMEKAEIVFGSVELCASGKGRSVIGHVDKRPVDDFLNNLLIYFQQQGRFLSYTKPFWSFSELVAAPNSGAGLRKKTTKQLFEAMIKGQKPPDQVTNLIVDRLKVEGVPNARGSKQYREWAQIAYLCWLAPDFHEDKRGKMIPDTSPENLFAWRIGQWFAAAKRLSYAYAARGGKPKEGWRDPLCSYSRLLFSDPKLGWSMIYAKALIYKDAMQDKSFWYDKVCKELADDCLPQVLPKRWSKDQEFFLAMGMAQIEGVRFSKAKEKAIAPDANENVTEIENSSKNNTEEEGTQND